MSYFIAGCGQHAKNIVAEQLNTVSLFFPYGTSQLRQGNPFLFESPTPKVIRDVNIENDSSGSWVSLLGMPLLDRTGANAARAFVDEFTTKPHQCLSNLIDGHVAVISYDQPNNRFYAATDFNSFVPIFYAKTQDGVLLASSELLLAKLVGSKLDPMGLAQSISLGTAWNDQTRFTNIKKLRPCELMTVSGDGKVAVQSYWNPNDEVRWDGNFDAVLERWMALLAQNVKRFCQASGQSTVSADLTGGEDSRLIVAQCHALGLSFRTRVSGFPGEADVSVAVKAAENAQIPIDLCPIEEHRRDNIVENASKIAMLTEGYGSFFSIAERFSLHQRFPPAEYTKLHFCGVPGGEAYRGSYYLRAKLLFPGHQHQLDERMFGKMKFLLDHIQGLFKLSDESFLEVVFSSLRNSVGEVTRFPAGTKVDHILRTFQTAVWSLPFRQPFYLPLGLRDITKSIYTVPPQYKQQGRLTRAATEILFPALAFTPTVNHVPTVRKTWRRLPLFLPGYYATARKVTLGTIRRVAHLNQRSKSLAKHHRADRHQVAIATMLRDSQYADWFRDADSMAIGEFFDAGKLNRLLDDARQGNCRHVQTLGQIINAELVARKVAGTT